MSQASTSKAPRGDEFLLRFHRFAKIQQPTLRFETASHSSRDQAAVDEIAALVGSAYVELDLFTFDRGVLTVDAIEAALKRSTMFVLFLTIDALRSQYVRFEALRARDLSARGLIQRFLVICLDEDAFAQADEAWKTYNFVRKPISPQSTARAIVSELLTSNAGMSASTQPFVGRGDELAEAKGALARPGTESAHSIYVSGIHGSVVGHLRNIFFSMFIRTSIASFQRFN